ncbi:MAG TPA: dihydrofolate reductase [Bacteroidales bacterium]|nr:dihydrofolate reductase [Bacteroidales bacterium]
MKTSNIITIMAIIPLCILSCHQPEKKTATKEVEPFNYVAEQFADIRILRYQVPGFEKLGIKEKKFLYCLQEAAYWGREIFYDQNYKHNLCIKRTLEAIVENYQGDKNSATWVRFMEYTKRFWFSNGIHHHYSNMKFLPGFSEDFFREQVLSVKPELLPLSEGETPEMLVEKLIPILFSPSVAPVRSESDTRKDLIASSATNYYEGLSQQEVERYYKTRTNKKDSTPISYGLNSKMIKKNGAITEQVYKHEGMYGAAIEKIMYWLTEAKKYCDNAEQTVVIDKLIEFYRTGSLETFDEYSILWVKNSNVKVDFTNGFIEVYADPLGYRGAWQSVVYVLDEDLTRKFANISAKAQWFEDNSPIMPEHKRSEVVGVSYKVINAVAEAGDCSPSTPIGVNLPNSNWIRSQYGSKSVSLGNIETAYDEASKTSGVLDEFYLPDQKKRIEDFGALSGKIHTALHEVIGHGSGKIMPGVGTPKETLKSYSSALEETRADLVALYYIMDPVVIDLGLMDTIATAYAEYDNYIINGMLKQLVRIEPGQQIVQAHMRCRSLISHWCYEKGKGENVIEKVYENGKTYYKINNYARLRELFGELLREVQRIKSEGDYEAGMKLVETYGAPVDRKLHKEVLDRYAKLNVAPYNGFIQPQMEAVYKNGEWVDVNISYPDSFEKQMMFYAKEYKILPTYN